jgi:hypothetical protein
MTQDIRFPVTAPDLVDLDDLDALGSETSSELQNLQQDCYHSLLAWPASNPDAPDRGVGVERYLSGTAADVGSLPAAIEADFLKDPRIQGCAATVTLEPDGSYLIAVQVEGAVGVVGLSYGYTQGPGLVQLG